MTQQKFDYRNYDRSSDKVMTLEQFTQVIEAIAEGKYSWACVLILRFAGYNPLHYIPYRTYNRLDKENSLGKRGRASNKVEEPSFEDARCESNSLQNKPIKSRISDLAYLEVVDETSDVQGGYYRSWLNLKTTNCAFQNVATGANLSRLLVSQKPLQNRFKLIDNLIR
jgi:arginine utilization protein RocB